jgi:hypothetical protein
LPFSFNNCNCSPLVIDNEFHVNNEALLAEYVGRIVLGHFAHIKRIIRTLSTTIPIANDSDIQAAIDRLKKDGKSSIDIEKRDGWVFQIISWLALFSENNGTDFYCQQPHDAPAQHGLDGVAIILNDNLVIESIIITEDKCTENHRVLIPKIWEEFRQFERGDHNNKLVSRVSALIENKNDGDVLEANQNNIYVKDIRKYRVGINRNDTYQIAKKRKKLFKGYDDCVIGTHPHRRFASTLHKDDIRNWMEQFSQKVIEYLESQKFTNV